MASAATAAAGREPVVIREEGAGQPAPGKPTKPETEEVGFFTAYIVQPAEWVGTKLWELLTKVGEACVWVWNTVFMCGCLADDKKEVKLSAFQEKEGQVRDALAWLGDRQEEKAVKTGMLSKKKVSEPKSLREGEAQELLALRDAWGELSPEGWATSEKPSTEADIKAVLDGFKVTARVEGEGLDAEEIHVIPESIAGFRQTMDRLRDNLPRVIALANEHLPEGDREDFARLIVDEAEAAYFGEHLGAFRQGLADFILQRHEEILARHKELQARRAEAAPAKA